VKLATMTSLMPDDLASAASRRLTSPSRLIVGIGGASGFVYGVRILQALRIAGVETHLVISKAARRTMAEETDLNIRDVQALAHVNYAPHDLGAAISSGSFRTEGMIIAPCSVKTLAQIALGVTDTLMARAADVVLKERRRLVLLFRETPLTLAHLKNMSAVTENGAIVALPVPAFYARPTTLDDVIEQTAGRVLDLFDIDTGTFPRWGGTALPNGSGRGLRRPKV
jgi:flavin prenyltransferase